MSQRSQAMHGEMGRTNDDYVIFPMGVERQDRQDRLNGGEVMDSRVIEGQSDLFPRFTALRLSSSFERGTAPTHGGMDRMRVFRIYLSTR